MKIFTDRFLSKPRHRPQHQAEPKQCEAITLAGKQCRLDARGGSPFCMVHRNWTPPRPPAVAG